MLSYLSNRHYHSLTQLLPPSLRVNQPQKIYYPVSNPNETTKLFQKSRRINYRTLGGHSSKEMLRREAVLKKGKCDRNANGCPLCGETHILVAYHGYKHICVKCRNFVRDQYGNQINIFISEKDGGIVCLGILPKTFEREKVAYYITDHTKLQVDNTGVYATFAGENELVLILKESENG